MEKQASRKSTSVSRQQRCTLAFAGVSEETNSTLMKLLQMFVLREHPHSFVCGGCFVLRVAAFRLAFSATFHPTPFLSVLDRAVSISPSVKRISIFLGSRQGRLYAKPEF